jgi:hypothetical protein
MNKSCEKQTINEHKLLTAAMNSQAVSISAQQKLASKAQVEPCMQSHQVPTEQL